MGTTGSTTTIRNPWRSNDQDGGRQFVYNRQPGVRLLLLLRCSRGFENVDDVVLDGLPPSYQIFANPEDAAMSKVKVRTDESVERVRRAHLNDMENIVPFLFIGLIYVGTSPAVSSAVFYFRLFAACRMVHTVVYAIVVMPQPSRALAYFGGMFVNLMMIASILSTYS